MTSKLLNEVVEEFLKPFVLLKRSSAEIKVIQLANFFDNLGFILLISLLALFMHKYIGLSDIEADTVIALSATIVGTLSFALLGSVVDTKGIKWALVVGSIIMLVGRFLYFGGIYCFQLRQGFYSALNFTVILGVILSIAASGLIIPARYATMSKYGDTETAKFGYAMLFAVYNMAVVAAGLISARLIENFNMIAPMWMALLSSLISLLIIIFLFKPKKKISENNPEQEDHTPTLTAKSAKKAQGAQKSIYKNIFANFAPSLRPLRLKETCRSFLVWLKQHPLRNIHFSLFLLCAIPLAIFLSQFWYSLPQYVSRAIPNVGLSHMQFYLFSLNSIFLIFMVPIASICFLKKATFVPVMIGTVVISLSPIPLITETSKLALVLFILILSVGQAMWQPTFIKFIAELAPANRKGAYIAASQIPLNIAQFLAGIIGGVLISNYCATSKTTEHAYLIWAIFLCITITAPIGLAIWKKLNPN